MKNDLLFIIRGSKFLSLVKMTNYDKIHRVRFTRVFNPHQSWILCKRKDFNLSSLIILPPVYIYLMTYSV